MTPGRRLDLGRSAPLVLASGADAVWVVGSDGVVLVDPEFGTAVSGTAVETVSTLLTSAISDAAVAPAAAVAVDDGLAVCVGPSVAIADPTSRLRRVLTPEPPDVAAAAGGRAWIGRTGSTWLVELDGAGEAGSHRLRRLDSPLIALTADDRGAWWIEAGDDVVRHGDRSIAIPAIDERSRIAAAAGSIWVTHDDSLTMIRSRDGSLGPDQPLPGGVVRHLTAVSGALVGGTSLDRVVVMNPAVDDGPRLVELGPASTIESIAGARGIAWLATDDGDVATLAV